MSQARPQMRFVNLDLQPRDPLAPVALGPVGAHPALVEALGVADVAIEVLHVQATLIGR